MGFFDDFVEAELELDIMDDEMRLLGGRRRRGYGYDNPVVDLIRDEILLDEVESFDNDGFDNGFF